MTPGINPCAVEKEQEQHDYDKRDVWCCTNVLYQMLTGQLANPFSCEGKEGLDQDEGD